MNQGIKIGDHIRCRCTPDCRIKGVVVEDHPTRREFIVDTGPYRAGISYMAAELVRATSVNHGLEDDE